MLEREGGKEIRNFRVLHRSTQRDVDEAQIMDMFERKANRGPTSLPLFGVLLVVLVITGVFLLVVGFFVIFVNILQIVKRF